jgi:hypothetical protein
MADAIAIMSVRIMDCLLSCGAGGRTHVQKMPAPSLIGIAFVGAESELNSSF